MVVVEWWAGAPQRRRRWRRGTRKLSGKWDLGVCWCRKESAIPRFHLPSCGFGSLSVCCGTRSRSTLEPPSVILLDLSFCIPHLVHSRALFSHFCLAAENYICKYIFLKMAGIDWFLYKLKQVSQDQYLLFEFFFTAIYVLFSFLLVYFSVFVNFIPILIVVG